MNSLKPFKYWLDHGATKEELMAFYAITETQYQKLLSCLNNLKAIENQKKQETRR